MPKARIITSRPELAASVADSLRQAGYSVDVTDPENASFLRETPELTQTEEQFTEPQYVVEREFVLAPLWRKWKLQFAQMFGRGRQPEFDDAPVSMSFLGLASEPTGSEPSAAPQQIIPEPAPSPYIARSSEVIPAPIYETLPAEEPAPAPPPVLAPVEKRSNPISEFFRKPEAEAEQPSPHIEEPIYLYEPFPGTHEPIHDTSEPVHEEATSVLRELEGVRMINRSAEPPALPPIPAESRWHERFEAEPAPLHAAYSEPEFTSSEPEFTSSEPVSSSSEPVITDSKPVTPDRVPKEVPARTPALVSAAMRVEELRIRAARKFAEWRIRPQADSRRDYVWRQAFPVATGLAIAFLVGWMAALHSSSSKPAVPQHSASAGGYTVGPQAPIPTSGYTVGPQASTPAAPLLAEKPSSMAATSPGVKHSPVKPVIAKRFKPSPRHRHSRIEDTADDVVVRHYSSKPKPVQIHSASLKRYSDID